jgi:hypothetical protein
VGSNPNCVTHLAQWDILQLVRNLHKENKCSSPCPQKRIIAPYPQAALRFKYPQPTSPVVRFIVVVFYRAASFLKILR